MQYDPRFELVQGNIAPPYRAYPLLATGDEILFALIVDLGDELEPEERTVERLREHLEAESGPDPSIVQLNVKDGDPQRTATIANRWAVRFVEAANDLYAPSKDEFAFYEEQLSEAEADLAQAEQDLVAFQANNEVLILTAQLNSKRAALDEYLSVARSVALIVQDAQALHDRLRAQDPSALATTSDELTSLLLQIDALNRLKLPIQLQISIQQDLGSKTVGDQVAFLDSLIRVLEGKRSVLEREAQVLEPDILALQGRLEEVQVKLERLQTVKQMARDTFVALSRKVTEARIAAQDSMGEVRLASRASVPQDPASPRKLVNAVIAGALGSMIGVLAAFAIEYWRRGQLDEDSAG
jgi:uncharacterized protein involved in exopolysaccharide biosynthesis